MADDDDEDSVIDPKEYDPATVKKWNERGIGEEMVEKLERKDGFRGSNLKPRMNMDEVQRYADDFTDGNMAYAWAQLQGHGVKLPFIGEEYEPFGFASYVRQRDRVAKPVFVMNEVEAAVPIPLASVTAAGASTPSPC